MLRAIILLMLAACLLPVGGCGGYYILNCGDHVAAAGEQAVIVSRLQRNDFFVLAVSVPEAGMRYQMADGLERAAYTDRFGYAGVTLPGPAKPGVHTIRVSHLDYEGEEIAAQMFLYVWDAERPGVAVDMDGLPRPGSGKTRAAAASLRRLAEKANILYLTRRSVSRHKRAHAQLKARGYPDGPILLWRRKRWHVVQEKWWKLKVIIESRLVSQLPQLRKTFPELRLGVCGSSLAAKAFHEAQMRCVLVGEGLEGPAGTTRVKSWTQVGDLDP